MFNALKSKISPNLSGLLTRRREGDESSNQNPPSHNESGAAHHNTTTPKRSHTYATRSNGPPIRARAFSPRKALSRKSRVRGAACQASESDVSADEAEQGGRGEAPLDQQQNTTNTAEVFTDMTLPNTEEGQDTSDQPTDQTQRDRISSDDKYNTPEAIAALIGKTRQDINNFANIVHQPGWTTLLTDRHAELSNKLSKITQYSVLNDFTEKFVLELRDLNEQLARTNANLLREACSVGEPGNGGAIPKATKGSLFRGVYADNSECDGGSETGLIGFDVQDEDLNRRIRRLENLHKKDHSIVKRVAATVREVVGAATVERDAWSEFKEKMERKSSTIVDALRQLSDRLVRLEEAPVAAVLSSITGRLEALEAKSARAALITQDEMDARILMAIGKAMEARDGHQLPPTAGGQSSHSGAGTSKPHEPSLSDSIAQVELATLKKVTRDLKTRLQSMEDRVRVGAEPSMRTSTPFPDATRPAEVTELASDYIRHALGKLKDQLSRLTSPLISDETDITELRKRKAVDVPRVEKTLTELSRKISDYCKGNVEDDFYQACLVASDNAQSWIDTVEAMYDKRDVHIVDLDRDKSGADVSKFLGDHSQTIYEFLEDFENAYVSVGSAKRRANLMHKKFLEEWIQAQTLPISHDYAKLKAWLLENYGDPEAIIKDLLEHLESIRKPQGTDAERLSFYLAVSNALTRLERLGSLPNMVSVEGHMQSWLVMSRLVGLLPKSDDNLLMQVLRNNGLSTTKIQGPHVLEHYKAFILSRVDDLKRNVEREARTTAKVSKPKLTKTTMSAVSAPMFGDGSQNSELSSEDDDCSAAQYVNLANAASPWWVNGLAFPCPIEGHSHELSACQAFFEMPPKARRKIGRGTGNKICYSCLRPVALCKRSCAKGHAMSEVLKCKECEPYASKVKLPAFCVLYCTNPAHSKNRAPDETIFKELRKYLKGMPKSLSEGNIVFANVGLMALNAAPNCPCKGEHVCSLSRRPNLRSQTPIIDTETGQHAPEHEVCSVSESNKEAFFLMQWIQIGGSRCLVLFDRGSNVNLIDGPLAEREQLQVISERPTGIKVIGGEEVSSQYGQYKVILGSKATGKFHGLECFGMPNVTARFGTHSLESINRELRLASKHISPSENLPVSVGGTQVHLLIGIQDVDLDPKYIETLPSGTGVYRSPFVDIFGSTVCYGGPVPPTGDPRAHLGAMTMLINEVQHFRDDVYGLNPPIPDMCTQVPCELLGDENPFLDPPLALPQACGPPSEEDDELPGAHLCSVLKALVPISKLRELIDQDDVGDVINFRCPDCSKCITCKRTSKTSAISIQSTIEQLAIQKSVKIDHGNRKVWVDLPFIQDPDLFLSKRHGGGDNYTQALKVYRSQCRKSSNEKQSLRLAMSQLSEQGFIKRLPDLPEDHQGLISAGPFRHFMVWRGQGKEDSPSTPCRIIVDPTMSGLNLCLPKGENRLGKINDILIKSRVSKHTWATDISKMYNQLALNPSSYRYQLLLFSPSLDATETPEIWVMVTAWYGMVPTGNQAAEAIDMLLEKHKQAFPMAVDPLSLSRYVDDINAGADTLEDREAQINDVREVLARGGFKLKYVVRSGEKPCEKASPDGSALKLLGYKYAPEPDQLSPGFTEVNPNRKIRGVKRPNEIPPASPGEALEILKGTKITRKLVMSLIAEFYDPLGLFEPIKLQHKLHLSALNTFNYKEALPAPLQDEWRERLSLLQQLPSLTIPRGIFPESAPPNAPIRLLCLSDAGEQAGGVAIYAGVELQPGRYTCSLLTSRSKLMKATIPRNELSAVMYMAELAFICKRAIGDRVKEILYLTDSTIALSWCHNTSLKLRMYVYNRVESIRRLIQWTTDSEALPLYHIKGPHNLADLITKPHPINFALTGAGSEWQGGADWMTLPFNEMPITSYENVILTAKKRKMLREECFDDPYFLGNQESTHPPLNSMLREDSEALAGTPEPDLASHATSVLNKPRDPLLVDLIALGWFRALRTLRSVLKFVLFAKHAVHKKKGTSTEDCPLCLHSKESALESRLWSMAEEYLFRQESERVRQVTPERKLKKYIEKDGILYFSSRLAEENPFRFRDLDSVPFLDSQEIIGMLPVVLADSPVFFAYLLAVHTKIVPHAGVMTTMREISKKMLVLNTPRKLIAKVRADCVKCRIILRKTVELEMQKHKFPRTMIAPPFYNIMIDIAYGFPAQPFKNARRKINMYALVIVCLLTGATNIIAIEGMETQEVVLALQTHSCTHGVPAEVFVDNGSQLKALNRARFSLQDVDVRLHDSLGLRVHVSNAKSHEERGRVERRIGLIRSMLERLTKGDCPSMTGLQWQSTFAMVANMIDNLPLAKGNPSNSNEFGFEILTANRLKLGRNNQRSLAESGATLDMAPRLTDILERNREIQRSWYQLFMDQIHLLMYKPPKWEATGRLPKEGDVVLFVLNDSGYDKKGRSWKLGVVVNASVSKVQVKYNKHKGKKTKQSTVDRNPRETSILFSADELFVNSSAYHQKAVTE